MTKTRFHRLATGLLPFILAACVTTGEAQHTAPAPDPAQARLARAEAMFAERCKKSGEFIHRTADNVEGIFLMKLRPEGINYGDQFRMDDPYGSDLGGDGYIKSFVRGSFQANTRGTPAPGPAPRYGVTYDDISTREEREHWIAGSSLKVIDLKTNEVMAERIGYMMDPGQGIRAGGRSPWLIAADNACPSFQRNPFLPLPAGRGAIAQSRQTQDFVEKVLKPKLEK